MCVSVRVVSLANAHGRSPDHVSEVTAFTHLLSLHKWSRFVAVASCTRCTTSSFNLKPQVKCESQTVASKRCVGCFLLLCHVQPQSLASRRRSRRDAHTGEQWTNGLADCAGSHAVAIHRCVASLSQRRAGSHNGHVRVVALHDHAAAEVADDVGVRKAPHDVDLAEEELVVLHAQTCSWVQFSKSKRKRTWKRDLIF